MAKINYKKDESTRVERLEKFVRENVDMVAENIAQELLLYSDCNTYHEASTIIDVVKHKCFPPMSAEYHILCRAKEKVEEEALKQDIQSYAPRVKVSYNAY